MGLLERLWAWLTSSKPSRHSKGHPDLYPLKVNEIASELGLLSEAKRLGEAGLPSRDATVISGPEAEVVQRVEKARQDYVAWATLRLNVISHDLGRRNVSQALIRAREADNEFERKAAALLTEKESLLRSLSEKARKQREGLDEFRAKHCLTRDANIVSGTRMLFLHALLLPVIGLEGLINANLFAKGLDTGLLGGFIEACGLAGLNVGVAYFFGRFAVRYVNHRNALLKGAGLVGCALAALAMVCIGLGIAHYRECLIDQVANPTQAALASLKSAPFQLNDVYSWPLFAVTIMFGIGALLDGLFMSDFYPGYSRISSEAQAANEEYEEELAALRSELEELKTNELTILDATLARAHADIAVSQSLIDEKKATGSRLSTAFRDVDNALTALLAKFRTENELHRKGVARPQYFDKQPTLNPVRQPDLSVSTDEEWLKEQKDLLSALQADIEEIRARIQAAFNQHFDQLRPLDSYFPTKELV